METNLYQLSSTREDDHYTSLKRSNMHELPTGGLQDSTATLNVAMEPKKKLLSSWSKQLLFITVVLCLILILLIIILGIVVYDKYATGNNVEFTNTATGANSSECETTSDSAQKLINIVNTLSNLQDTSTSTAGVADDILLIAQELLVLHNDSTALPTSCKQIQEQQPNSPSGYYILVGPNGTFSAYCNMGTLCGSGGGWTRLAYLDMSDATQNCPSGFRLHQSRGVRACGRTTNGGGCVSVKFPSNGISYSQICGRVTGYQYGTIDAVNTAVVTGAEGVTISRGPSQQHVWTLMAGYSESRASSGSCPCITGSRVSVPAYIGNNYFCESGNPKNSRPSRILYTSDPLWDGQGCHSRESPCCNVPGIPWFHRDYGSTTTTDYIELRVCGDGGSTNDEDTPVNFYEIYVK